MKLNLSLAFSLFLMMAFVGCTKTNSNTDGSNPFYTPPAGGGNTQVDPLNDVGPLPGTFTKKGIIHMYTGEWCPACPSGAANLKSTIANNPDKVLGIAVHYNDFMEVPDYWNYMDGLFSVNSFPTLITDLDRSNSISASLAKTAECGMAIVTKKNGSLYDIKVFVGYNTKTLTDTRLSVVVTEDKVPEQSQSGGSPGYLHYSVLRGSVTDIKGDVIDMKSAKNYTIVEFSNVDLAAMNIKDINNVHIGAFIHSSSSPFKVYNAQMVSVGSTKKWD